MNPFSYIDTTPQEEEQVTSKFLKILQSLGEHASSFLFQKGVVLGDDSYQQFEQQLEDEKYQKFVINALLRPGDNNSQKESIYPAAAIFLLQLTSEATQIFLDIKKRSPQQTGTSSGIVALGYHLALMERITAFLNLPSLNDKSYWNLMTGSKKTVPSQSGKNPPQEAKNIVATPVPRPSPKQPEVVIRTADKPQAAAIPQTAKQPVTKSKPPVSSPAPARSSSIFSEVAETAPKDKRSVNTIPPRVPIAPAKPNETKAVKPLPVKPMPTKAKSSVRDGAKVAAEAVKKEQPSKEPSQSEGPIKAMVRRIVKEINDDSYDAVLAALKDNKLMMNLHKHPDDPMAVKVLEVDTKERKVHLIRKKLAPKEAVTFRLIRKMLSEL